MDIVNFFEKLNWQTILALFVMGWYFSREIRISLHKLEDDVRQQGLRTDKLYQMFIDLLKDGRK